MEDFLKDLEAGINPEKALADAQERIEYCFEAKMKEFNRINQIGLKYIIFVGVWCIIGAISMSFLALEDSLILMLPIFIIVSLFTVHTLMHKRMGELIS